MSKTVKQRIHRTFSAFIAVSLALLMVPIVPGGATQALAADGDNGWVVADEGNDFAKTLLYDPYGGDSANPWVDQKLTDAAKEKLDFEEPSVSSTPDSVKSAIDDQKLKDVATAIETSGEALNNFNSLTTKNEVLTAAGKKWIEDENNAEKVKEDVKAEIVKTLETSASVGDITLYDDKTTFKSVTTDGTIAVEGINATSADMGDDLTISYTFDNEANFVLNEAKSSNLSVVDAAKTGDDAYKLQAKSASGSADITLSYGYAPTITGYTYSYSGTCDYEYTDITYSGYKYTQNYTYTVAGDPTEKTTGDLELKGGEVTYRLDSSQKVPGQAFEVPETEAPKLDEPLKTEEKSGAYTFPVQTEDLFAGLKGDSYSSPSLTIPFAGTDESIGYPFESSTYASDEAKAHVKEILSGVEPSFASDSLNIEWKNGELSVTGKKATAAEVSVDVEWQYGTASPLVTYTVNATVEPAKFDLTSFKVSKQDYKLEANLKADTLKEVNDQIRLLANEMNRTVGAEEIAADYFPAGSASVNYDPKNTAGEEDASLVLDAEQVNSDAYANFEASSIPTEYLFDINSVGEISWAKVGMTLQSNEEITTADASASTWIRQVPQVKGDGSFAFAYNQATPPTTIDDYGEPALSAGDGTHTVQLYAANASTGVVSRVEAFTYLLDTQAPKLASATYGGSGTVLEPDMTLFGVDSVRVNLGITEGAKGNASEADTAQGSDTYDATTYSGLKGAPEVEYYDSEGEKSVPRFALSGEGPIYSFDLGANEDVSTNSIRVYAEDNAGNELNMLATEADEIPENVLRLVADADAPEVEAQWDNTDVRNGRYYNANRTLTVTVTDHFFDYIKKYKNDQTVLQVKENGTTAIVVHPSDFEPVADNVWRYTLSFTTDADWDVSSIAVTDVVGHAGSAAGQSFTIDKTAPAMDVVFDNNSATNGNYYNVPRTATITVTEHNFDAGLVNIEPTANAGNGSSFGAPNISGWKSDGDVRTATVNFPGQGVYTLSVGGSDLALNALSSYTASEFVIDTERPQIAISGVDNRTAFAGVVQPNVQVTDTNISDATSVQISKAPSPFDGSDANPYTESRSTSATEITVSYPNPAEVVENDGVYTVTVEAVDMAGNTDSQALVWSVNRFGSTYVISDTTTKMLNSYLKDDDVYNVKVTEINPQSLVEDSTAVELTKDTSNSTLKRGQNYSVDESDQSGWHAYDYDISKDNFESDGMYKVLLHSQDESSNKSENTMAGKDKTHSSDRTAEISFAVDNKEPDITFANLSDGPYDETAHTGKVSIEDNLKLDYAVVTVDGEEVKTFDADELSASSVHEFDIEGNDGHAPRNVVVTAYDAAGNSKVEPVSVTVTTNPVALWMSNTPLFIGSIVVGAGVIGAAVAFFAFRARRVA